jgi:arylsulfatase A-like enzyme
MTGLSSNGPVEFVIHISVDGLKPDAINNLGAERLPAFFRLRTEGAFTDNARTDFDFTVTLPNHTAQLTGRPAIGPHGHHVTFNKDNDGTLHEVNDSYVAGVFDIVHDRGLHTGFYASKPKFDFLNRSWNSDNGATDTTGTDDGRKKIDFSIINSNTTDLIDGFLSNVTKFPHHYSFIHLKDTDRGGHRWGWGSQRYEDALEKVDELLGLIFDLVDTNPTYASKTAVILTSDHGGSGTGHGDSEDQNNYTIPFYVWGPVVAAGGDLYLLNENTRQEPGTLRPDNSALPQPIRNGDAANLALDLLGLPAVPGSSVNVKQDLRVTRHEDNSPR